MHSPLPVRPLTTESKAPSWAQRAVRTVRLSSSHISPARIAMVGAIVNTLLSAFKVGVGCLAGSAALIADGWHSLSDLVTDVLCMASVKLGANGHGHYEHVCTLCIAAMLVLTGGLMTLHSGSALLAIVRSSAVVVAAPAAAAATGMRAGLDAAALCVATASVVSKELLFSVSHAIGVRCRSPSLIANAYHHRSDALSSVVAIVGIFGAMCGCPWLDPFAATAVGVMVLRMGGEVAHESLVALGPDSRADEDGEGLELAPVIGVQPATVVWRA